MKTSFGEKSSGTSLQIHKTVRFPLRRLVCSYIAGSGFIPLNFIFHAVGILSELDRMFPVDLAFKIQLNNSLIHGDHT